MTTITVPQTIKARPDQIIRLDTFFSWKLKPSGVWVTITPFYQDDIDFRELSKEEITPAMRQSVKEARKIKKHLLCDL